MEIKEMVEEQVKLREITLVVDELWYDAIINITSEVYDGETCEWLRNEVI
jgi:hypothetical protein